MKKIFTLAFLSTFTAALFAQQFSNPGFENWANGIPDNWSTTKSIVPSATNVTQDTQTPYTGTSDVRIVTAIEGSPIDTFSGFVHYGPLNAGVVSPEFSRVSFPCLPDSLDFYYKYTSVGGDQGAVSAYFSNVHSGNGTNYFIDGFPLPASANWQHMTFGFFGQTFPIPDSLDLTFYSSFSFITNTLYHAGSTAWIDKVSFIYNNGTNCKTTTAINPITGQQLISVYPNPAAEKIIIKTDRELQAGAQLHLFDNTGREVYTAPVTDIEMNISTSNLANGSYLLHITGTADGENNYVKHLVIVH